MLSQATNGWGGNASITHTSLQEQQEIKTDILKKEWSNIQGWTLNLNWNDKKKIIIKTKNWHGSLLVLK